MVGIASDHFLFGLYFKIIGAARGAGHLPFSPD